VAAARRSAVGAAVASWAEERGLEQVDPAGVVDAIELDILRNDPWGPDSSRRRLIWLRALMGLNPLLFAALFTGSESDRPARFFSTVAGDLDGRRATLCHFSSLAAPPYWLDFIPFGWVVGLLAMRARLTFWQLRLEPRESAPYAGMISARDRAGQMRIREIAQGRRLVATDRIFGHREESAESEAFLERYSLLVPDDAQDVAVRDMFGPSYLVYLAEKAPEGFFVELRGQVLTAGVPRLVSEPAELDALCEAVERTLRAVLDGAGAVG
jgi:hypothetical protein